jgi:REP element-mobilizing transposase RayT
MLPFRFYHLYNQSNGTDNLFRTEENYHYFLQKWSIYVYPIAETYAYCLMANHVHFLIRIRALEELNNYYLTQGKDISNFRNLSEIISKRFSNLFNSYAKSYNVTFDRKGSLFQRPFKRKEIQSVAYLSNVVHYIHSNPVHHGFVKNIHEWPYSSYHSIYSAKDTKLKREEVLNWFGGRDKYLSQHIRSIDRNLTLDIGF